MIGVQVEGIDAAIVALKDYPESRTPRAMVRAMNVGIKSGKTRVAQLISKEIGLKYGEVMAALRLQEATLARPEARLSGSLRPLSLKRWNPKGRFPSFGRRPGITVSKLGRSYPHAFFIGPRGNGHVFEREGRERLPIRRVYGPSIGEVFRKHRSAGVARTQEQFDKSFAHELKRFGGDTARAAGSD